MEKLEKLWKLYQISRISLISPFQICPFDGISRRKTKKTPFDGILDGVRRTPTPSVECGVWSVDVDHTLLTQKNVTFNF